MRKSIAIISAVSVLIFLACYLAVSNLEKKKDDFYRQIEIFSDSLSIIERDYVDDVKPKDLIYGALRGMLSSLDAHSQFLDPQDYSELKVTTEGKFGGLGIEITFKDGLLTIVTPLEGTPAWRAGLKSQDRIVKINNELTRNMSLSETVRLMRGKPQEAVHLTILRESEKKVLEFNIVRDIIKIQDIKEVRILEEGIGYIRIAEFREDTPQDFNAALQSLSKLRMKALILDLRNNPGGLLESALEITGKFIPLGKLIVYTKGRKNDQDVEYSSRSAHPIINLPMVVLINEGSASGSEILAGCLQDYKRALILGRKSFGKGSVQTVIPLGDGSALRLTTSRYFTPFGKQINGKGVIPDIELEEGSEKDRNQDLLDEEGLSDTITKPEELWDYKTDAFVTAAINLLRPMSIDKKVTIR